MKQNPKPWDRPIWSGAPNRQGDPVAEPIFAALGRALSAWEGVNAAINSLFHAMVAYLDHAEHDKAVVEFNKKIKTHERADTLRKARDLFVASDFGERRDEVARFKRSVQKTLVRYVEWVARRNELAHGYVTEAWSPDYSKDDQPIIEVYALLPSHAREDRWHHEEPEWNYLAGEIEEFARQFRYLDDALEQLANSAAQLSRYRRSSEPDRPTR